MVIPIAADLDLAACLHGRHAFPEVHRDSAAGNGDEISISSKIPVCMVRTKVAFKHCMPADIHITHKFSLPWTY